jgi:hypothetical protein
VIAVGEHPAASPPVLACAERGIDEPRRGDLEALHAARERHLVLGLDQHVDVRALEADVHDAEPIAHCREDRGLAHDLVHHAPPQAPHRRHNAHHDVERVVWPDLGPRVVPRACPRTLRLAAGALALAAAPEQRLLDVPLARTLRLRRRHCFTDYHACAGCPSIRRV